MSALPSPDKTPKHSAFSGGELLLLTTFFTLVGLAWFYSPGIANYLGALNDQLDPGSSLERRGQFGDSYAVTNTLFSGLAFVALVAALLFQRRDLMSQVDALRQQVTEFEDQNTLTRQQMAFQEIHQRISAVPFFKVHMTPRELLAVGDQLQVGFGFKLTNEGPRVFKADANATDYKVKMDTQDEIFCGVKNDGDPFNDPPWWIIRYVTLLGEPGWLKARMVHADTPFTVFTEFDVEAAGIRKSVLKRFQLEHLHDEIPEKFVTPRRLDCSGMDRWNFMKNQWMP